MLKYFICLCMCLAAAGSVFSQSRQDTLLVVPAKTGSYVYHVVAQGETLYSLSRIFRLQPSQLAAFNGITLKTPLKLYQLLKIPLTAGNLDQSAGAGQVSGSRPLYHKVTKGETLYHLGKLYDNVSPALLREWNHLSDNAVKIGQYVIVGWLDTGAKNSGHLAAGQNIPKDTAKNIPAAPLQAATEPPAPHTGAPTASPRQEPSAAAPAAAPQGGGFLGEVIASENRSRGHQSARPATPGPASTSPGEHRAAAPAADDAFTVQAPTTPAPASSTTKPVAVPATVSVSPEQTTSAPEVAPADIPPVAASTGSAATHEEPAPTSPETTAAAAVASAPTPEPADSFSRMLDRVTHRGAPAASGAAPEKEPAPAQPSPAGDSLVMDSAKTTTGTEMPVESAFEQAFAQQTAAGKELATRKGAAGWFRSNVKPGSGRYYALCDDLPRGTIVKVVNPINQKSVLVKILDVIPKQKENYNLIIKLSDAAMGDLGVSQARFWCEINYAKPD